MSKLHVYVAGPFTAPTPEDIEANIQRAEALAAELIEWSIQIVCVVPHSLGRKFTKGPGSPEYWYAATLSLLKRCDAMVLVPGWENSKGTRAEVDWCQAHGVPVFQDVETVIAFARRRAERAVSA